MPTSSDRRLSASRLGGGILFSTLLAALVPSARAQDSLPTAVPPAPLVAETPPASDAVPAEVAPANAFPVPSRFAGEVVAGPGSIFVALRIDPSTDGAPPRVEVTMPQAGALRQVAEGTTLEGGRLSFTLVSMGVRGRFVGSIDGDGRYAGDLTLAATGQKDITVAFALPRTEIAAEIPGVVAYRGSLPVPGGSLEMTIALAAETPHGPVASLDVPAQGAEALPLLVESREGGTWRFRMLVGRPATIVLSEVEDGTRLEGTFSQAGLVLPLSMRRLGAYDRAGLRRPQHPEPPFPYVVREVEFVHPHGHRLAGTLTLPTGASAEKKVPAVALATGSGPQDRDETIFGHKPFLVLADALTRAGVAVLRYDDRGVGGSSGSFGLATSWDLASDLDAASEFLKEVPEVDPARVGLVGHSEGAMLAPMVARWQTEEEVPKNPIAFVVLLAPPGVPGHAILRLQMRRLLEASTTPEDLREAILVAQGRLLDAAIAKDEAAMREAARDLATAQASVAGAGVVTDEMILQSAEGMVEQMNSPWMQVFLEVDPAAILASIKAPVLVVIGSLDLQVDPGQNLPPIKAALRQAGVPSQVRVLEGLNHLLQPATKGSIDEYGVIEVTIDPTALGLIVEWVVRTSGVAAAP